MPFQSGIQSNVARLWMLDENGELLAMPVRKGATDGQMTEIAMIDPMPGLPSGFIANLNRPHLEEGMKVISGATQSKEKSTKTKQRSGPSGPPFGRRPF